MRLKNIPNALEKIQNSPYFIDSFKDINKKLEAKVFLEIGMGKGDFITKIANKDHQNIFIGIEKYPSVQIYAINKISKFSKLDNVKLMSFDATEIDNYFEPQAIDGIYLNFSDPWPKNKHQKRRLTYKTFLEKYLKVLSSGGVLEIKTDQKELYNFTLENLNQVEGFEIIETSLDLHNFKSNIITTEYENRFLKDGKSIYFIKALKDI